VWKCIENVDKGILDESGEKEATAIYYSEEITTP